MKPFLLGVILILYMSAAIASEHGEEGETKKKAEAKPKPDSAISTVLALPIVMKWNQWLSSSKDVSLIAWGEAVSEVDGHRCWRIAVGEKAPAGIHLLRHFCVMQTGVEVWVEKINTDSMEQISYYTYDDWLSSCKPDSDSLGKC